MITMDERVRYSPELGVWTINLSGMTAATTGQAERILGRAMFYARDAGSTLDGCTCDPGDQHWEGPRVRVPTDPHCHDVTQAEGMSGEGPTRLLVIGHGGRVVVAGVTAQEHQGHPCPLRNEVGERRAKELVERGALEELWALTVAYPVGSGPLAPLEPAAEAPEAWEGEPVRFNAGGFRINVPGRHLHPEVRAALAAYEGLAQQAAELSRAAHDAEEAHRNAPRDLRRQVAQAAVSGKPADAREAAQSLRDLELAAISARAVADGTSDALEARRAAVVAAVEGNRAEWLAYLSGQGRAALGKLEAALTALDEAAQELVLVDTMRSNVERPTAAGGRPLAQGSSLAAGASAAISSGRAFVSQAAQELAPLGRHDAGQRAETKPAARKGGRAA